MEKQIVAPLPGKILRVDVSVGDHVAAGQQVFLFESMKMEMPIESEVDGVVAGILVAVGEFVQANSAVITLT